MVDTPVTKRQGLEIERRVWVVRTKEGRLWSCWPVGKPSIEGGFPESKAICQDRLDHEPVSMSR